MPDCLTHKHTQQQCQLIQCQLNLGGALCRYMLLFLHKPEAEQAVLNGLHKLFPAPKQPPKYSLQEVQHVLQMLARPGAATAGINWYR